ncbi:MAG: hypothetical protein IIW05_00620 [Paludibacteraceae bacterium]|nr:hypothetical protein [Paludibacteraceae bacterium]MBQ5774348.1 hypothetical protein [Paludibacteraceae bacterium]
MESLEKLERNIHQLLNKYQELLLELTNLKEENQRCREEVMQTHAELLQLKQEYAKLHTAHTMLLADEAKEEDRIAAKQRITNVILQVDKAIEVLTE